MSRAGGLRQRRLRQELGPGPLGRGRPPGDRRRTSPCRRRRRCPCPAPRRRAAASAEAALPRSGTSMPERPEQARGLAAVARGRLDLEHAAVDEEEALADPELVALGVAAEVVVVVEDEDARPRPRLLAEEVRRGRGRSARRPPPRDRSARRCRRGAPRRSAGRTGSACATSHDPSWLPRMPVRAGG